MPKSNLKFNIFIHKEAGNFYAIIWATLLGPYREFVPCADPTNVSLYMTIDNLTVYDFPQKFDEILQTITWHTCVIMSSLAPVC